MFRPKVSIFIWVWVVSVSLFQAPHVQGHFEIIMETSLYPRMSVCVWRPLLFSAVVIWRISTSFLGAINLQGKEKSSSFLTVVLSELCQLYCKESTVQTLYQTDKR